MKSLITLPLIILSLWCTQALAFWRLTCGVIRTGRLDPIVTPGSVSGHTHTIVGPINFNTTSDYNSLQQSFCTSCSVQKDKSAYWTPLLYYQFKNGSVTQVPNDGTIIYYLGRGEDRANIIPFPPGFQMLSGDPFVRAYDNATMTYGNKTYQPRPISDRVSFNCLNFKAGPVPETPNMANTYCPDGLRAQIHFPTCWNGKDLYKTDQSHVAHLSQIDNGVCPPTHPKLLPHLFYEVYYFPTNIDTSDGGSFTFANGDKTGYGFHGDFLNGWDIPTLQAGISQCINTVDSGQVSDCPPLYASVDPYASQNCPKQPPLFNEQVEGILPRLPGCNVPTSGPSRATPNTTCPYSPSLNPVINYDGLTRIIPTVNKTTITVASGGNATYRGCFVDATNGRLMNGAGYTNNTGMTTESCAAYCKNQGYSFFGLEYAQECYCDSKLPDSTYTTNSSDCSMACKGNMTQYCGAGVRLSVWSLGSSSSSSTSTGTSPGSSQPTNTAIIYVGCTSDNTGGRSLSNSYNQANMTIDKCATTAQSLNLAYFGLEYGSECWAGNTLASTATTLASGKCNMPCAGDKGQMCGGPGALNLYKNSLYSAPSIPRNVSVTTNSGSGTNKNVTFVFQGCFKESTSGRALGSNGTNVKSDRSTNANMTVNLCASTCYSQGYSYAGVEYANECYCNNIGVTNGGTAAAEDDCGFGTGMICAGDKTQFCGSGGRVAVYAIAQNTVATGSGTMQAAVAAKKGGDDYKTTSSTTTTSSKTKGGDDNKTSSSSKVTTSTTTTRVTVTTTVKLTTAKTTATSTSTTRKMRMKRY